MGTSRGQYGSASIIGSASTLCPGAAGDTTSLMIEDRNIQNVVLADGPAGLRLSATFLTDSQDNQIPGTGGIAIPGAEELLKDVSKPKFPQDARTYYQYCTAIPIATLLAQTHRALPYQPRTKGQIERFFGGVCSRFSKQFSSYTGTLTGSRTDAKIPKDIQKMPVLSE